MRVTLGGAAGAVGWTHPLRTLEDRHRAVFTWKSNSAAVMAGLVRGGSVIGIGVHAERGSVPISVT